MEKIKYPSELSYTQLSASVTWTSGSETLDAVLMIVCFPIAFFYMFVLLGALAGDLFHAPVVWRRRLIFRRKLAKGLNDKGS